MTHISVSSSVGVCMLGALRGAPLADYLSYIGWVVTATGTLTATEKLIAQNWFIETAQDRAIIKRASGFLGDAAARLVPFVRDWGIAGSDIVTGSGTTFDTLRGYLFNGSGALRTGVIPSSASGFSTLNCHLSVSAYGDFTTGATRTLIGANSSGGTTRCHISWQTTPVVLSVIGLNSEIAITASGSVFSTGPRSGTWVAATTAANNGVIYRNGDSSGTDTAFTTDGKANITVEIYVGGLNANGALSQGYIGTISSYSIGTGADSNAAKRMTRAWDHLLNSTGRMQNVNVQGDSRDAAGSSDYVQRMVDNDFPTRSFVNSATGGITTAQILALEVTNFSGLDSRKWYCQIIGGGCNDSSAGAGVFSPTAFRANMAAIIGNLGHQLFRVWKFFPQSIAAQYTGTSLRTDMNTANGYLTTDYSTKAIDALAALQAGSDGSANDISDVANGIVPRSKMADTKHATTGAPVTGNSIIEGVITTSLSGGF